MTSCFFFLPEDTTFFLDSVAFFLDAVAFFFFGEFSVEATTFADSEVSFIAVNLALALIG